MEFIKLRSLYRLGPEQQNILALSWEKLVEKLQTRELSAKAALEAYIAKV